MARFQYGVCEWAFSVRGEELCRMAAQEGLDCLQLGVGTEIFTGGGLNDPQLVHTYQEAREHDGLVIDSLSPQFVDQYSYTRPQNMQEVQIVEKLTSRTVELCRVLGCKKLLLPVLGKNGIFDSASFHRAVDYIRRFAAQASEQGIETGLELNLSTEKAYDLLDAVDNPMVKLFFDSQNLYALDGTSMARYFRTMEPVIGGVHLKDGIGTALSGSLLGEGTSGFYQTAQAILESGYKGALLIESVYSNPTVCTLGTPQELLARDVATLRHTFG